MSKPKTGPSDKPATPPAAGQPPATPPAETPESTPKAEPKTAAKGRLRDFEGSYVPTGTVRVIAEGARGRVLEDNVRRWKEPR